MKGNNITNMFLMILVIFLLVLIVKQKKEGWYVYQQLPYGNYYNGSGLPASFYARPKYRKPYMFPVCHRVNYPVPHCRTLD